MYWSIRSLTDATEFFEKETTNEHQRMAIMLQREFERDGIHMSDKDQQQVMEHRNHITRLETKFTQIASGQSGPLSSERENNSNAAATRGDTATAAAPDHVVVSKSKLATFMPQHLLKMFPAAQSSTLWSGDDDVIVPVASYYGGDEIVETSNALCEDRRLRQLIYSTKHHVGMEQNVTD